MNMYAHFGFKIKNLETLLECCGHVTLQSHLKIAWVSQGFLTRFVVTVQKYINEGTGAEMHHAIVSAIFSGGVVQFYIHIFNL